MPWMFLIYPHPFADRRAGSRRQFPVRSQL